MRIAIPSKRRCLLGLGIGLTMLIAAVPLDPTFTLRGWLRGESFFQDRPTSYWSRQIRRSVPEGAPSTPPKPGPIGWLTAWWDRLSGTPDEKLPVFENDPAAIPVLRELLHDGNPRARWKAAFALLDLKAAQPRELIPQLADALVTDLPNPPDGPTDLTAYRVRGRAALLLAELGAEAEPAIPALILAMTDHAANNGDSFRSFSSWPFSRGLILHILGTIGPSAVPALIDTLKHGDKEKRLAAAKVLADMGADARAAVPALRESLTDDDVRLAAFRALWKIDPEPPELLAALLATLRHPDAKMRQAVIEELGELIGADLMVVPALADALKDRNQNVRLAAAIALVGITPHEKGVRSEILAAWARPGSPFRHHLPWCLGRLAREDPKVLPLLADAMDTEDSSLVYFASMAIEGLGEAAVPLVPALIEQLEARRHDRSPVQSLASIGPPARAAVPALIRVLRDPREAVGNEWLREEAIAALGKIGPDAHAAVPDLCSVLEYGRNKDQLPAAKALGQIGPAAVPALRKQLGASRPATRYLAAVALGAVGPAGMDALPDLHRAMKDPEAEVAVAAALACWQISGKSEDTVPVLLGVLRNTDAKREVRDQAAQALAKMGPAARAAVPALSEHLRADDDSAYHAIVALDGIGPTVQTIPALIRGLTSQVSDIRWRAAWLLGRLGADAAPAVPALGASLSDPKIETRRAAAGALSRIGPAAAPAVPALAAALKDRNAGVRASAAHALGQIGPAAEAAVPALAEALRDKYSVVRWASIQTLGRIGPKAAGAAGTLGEVLTASRVVIRLPRDGHPVPRYGFDEVTEDDCLWREPLDATPVLVELDQRDPKVTLPELAARALGRMGPAARSAIPALRQATNDPVTAIRREARRALEKVAR